MKSNREISERNVKCSYCKSYELSGNKMENKVLAGAKLAGGNPENGRI